ncbi:MAG: 23S rRNA (pseudouridine(1915)-N(3))-methyltransferase RlmH [Firmicutes bacterium]|nr:23S rRNA (pseudouridine(1915)-N(3))-methyltransferase RlmH [Bacillota bacterium]
MAEKVESLGIDGHSNVVFVIGGRLGLSAAVSKRANFKLSFSEMTFPHQMMRVILLEQVYRAFKIIRNEAYHK